MRKIIVALLALTLLLSVCQTPLTVSAAGSTGFELQASTAAVAGGYAEVTLSYNGTKEKVGGLHFHLEFDSSVLSYESGSRTVSVPGITENDLGTDTCVGNKIYFVWESVKNQGVTVKGNIVTYRFKVNPELEDDVTQTSVRVVVQSFYKDDYPIMTDYIYSSVAVSCSIPVSTNASLNDVIAKIDNIGTVVLDDGVKQRIEDARAAYNSLSPSLRESVYNSEALFAAEKQYAQLLEAAENTQLQQKVDAFRSEYAQLLDKQLEDLTLADKESIEKAVSAWEALDMDVRAATIADKRKLNSFLTKMEALQKDAEAWKEAEDLAKSLREKYAGILKLDPSISDDILLENEESIRTFLDEINENAEFFKYLSDVMAEDIAFLTAFTNRLDNMDRPKELHPDALAFQNNFGWLLNYTEDTIAKSDLPDLQTALYAYSLLPDEAKADLEGVEAHLLALQEKAKSLPDEVITEVITQTNTEIVYVDKVVEVESEITEEEEAQRFAIKLPGQEDSVLLCWMLGFAVFMVLTLTAELCLYGTLLRKKKQQEVVEA